MTYPAVWQLELIVWHQDSRTLDRSPAGTTDGVQACAGEGAIKQSCNSTWCR